MLEKIKNITRGQLILIILILVSALSVYIGINIAQSNSVKNYEKFEKELIVSAKNYYRLEKLEISKSEEKRINITTLDKKSLVQNNLKNKCKGYVTITNERDIYTEEYELVYRSYIKCGSYSTKGYIEY